MYLEVFPIAFYNYGPALRCLQNFTPRRFQSFQGLFVGMPI